MKQKPTITNNPLFDVNLYDELREERIVKEQEEKEWRDAIHEKRMLCGETDGREDDEE
jgi:hypothetical protein